MITQRDRSSGTKLEAGVTLNKARALVWVSVACEIHVQN